MSDILNNDFSKEVFEITYKYGDETVEDMFRRVAKHIASVEADSERWEKEFYDILSKLKFISGGRIMSNAGTSITSTTLINCFVSGFTGEDQDSMNGILDELRRQAMILKSEGGYGFCADVMRPKGSFVYGIANESPGAVRMLNMWDTQSDTITAGSDKKSGHKLAKGRIRKGAQMVTMSCWHPDIEEFITAKQTPGRLTKFNMSVLITDKFMAAVEHHEPWELIFPHYDQDPATKSAYKKLWDGNIDKWIELGLPTRVHHTYDDANELWDLIMTSTYNRNEPGVLFIDTINRKNNLNYIEHISGTNPCGEQLLPIGGVCLLGSINLTQFVKDGDFDYVDFVETIKTAVRFMDNVNDITYVPLDIQYENLKNKRRLGMGVVGYASMLMMLGIRYGSEGAMLFTDNLMRIMKNTAYTASSKLATEKGKFKDFDVDKYMKSEFVQDLNDGVKQSIRKNGMRNSHLLSIQPTGNTSSFANVISSGLEPIFLFEYIRTVIVQYKPKDMILPKNINYAGRTFDWDSEEDCYWSWVGEGNDNLLRTNFKGTVYKMDSGRGLTKENIVSDYAVRYLKEHDRWDQDADWAVDTSKITVKEHIDTMEVFSKHIDSAMSKTINLPNNYSYDEFKNIYKMLYDTGTIKGGTTYRAGTMAHVLSSTETKVQETRANEIVTNNSPKRPKDVPCDIIRFQNQGEKWIGFMGILKGKPYEMFTGRLDAFNVPSYVENGVITKHKNGNGSRYDLVYTDKSGDKVIMEALNRSFEREFNNITKMLSAVLRHGMPLLYVYELVKSLNLKFDNVEFGTWKSGLLRMIKKYIDSSVDPKEKKCPECGDPEGLKYEEGCIKCKNCSYSVCK